MLDRTTSLLLILLALLALFVPLGIWIQREAYWRRLRRRGDPRAKRRELERQRRRSREA